MVQEWVCKGSEALRNLANSLWNRLDAEVAAAGREQAGRERRGGIWQVGVEGCLGHWRSPSRLREEMEANSAHPEVSWEQMQQRDQVWGEQEGSLHLGKSLWPEREAP